MFLHGLTEQIPSRNYVKATLGWHRGRTEDSGGLGVEGELQNPFTRGFLWLSERLAAKAKRPGKA
jgi:hypothetical protein